MYFVDVCPIKILGGSYRRSVWITSPSIYTAQPILYWRRWVIFCIIFVHYILWLWEVLVVHARPHRTPSLRVSFANAEMQPWDAKKKKKWPPTVGSLELQICLQIRMDRTAPVQKKKNSRQTLITDVRGNGQSWAHDHLQLRDIVSTPMQ